MSVIRNRKKFPAIALTILALIVSVIFVFPIFYLFVSSFKHYVDLVDASRSFKFLPTLDNYITTFRKTNFYQIFLNSAILDLGSISISTALGVPAAYGLARTNLSPKIKREISFWFLSMLILPPVVFVIPMYYFLSSLSLLNTHVGLIIVYTLFNIPFIVWMMRNYFLSVPREIEEASFLDGCSSLQSLLKVVLPLSLPGLVASLLFCFVISWNEFLFAFIFTGAETSTLPKIPRSFVSQQYLIALGLLFAQGVLIISPVIVIGVAIQRYFIKGLSFGAVK